MNNHPCKIIGYLAAGMVLIANPAFSEDSDHPFYQGGYITPMGTITLSSGADLLGTGLGGTVAAGYRGNFFAFEGRGSYSKASADGSVAHFYGGTINGLLFPFRLSVAPKFDRDSFSGGLISNIYAVIGVGAQDLRNYPGVSSSTGTSLLQGGVGDLLPLRFGRYQFGVRAEVLYQHGFRDQSPKDITYGYPDVDAPENFRNIVFNIGLQLPFGLTHEPPQAPPPPPPEVVPVEAAPPPPPPPPPPPCVMPEAGQPISLQGCKAGDRIILHGVNFDFNKATLTVNAKTILDQVASELKKYTEIDVEVGGYTDGRGSVQYNLRLSDRRAASVKAYLIGAGVAANRMTSVGYGKADPVADNNTDEGRELNRRVELKITSGVASSSTTSTDAGTTTTAVTPAAPADAGTSPAPADAAPASPAPDASPPAAPAAD